MTRYVYVDAVFFVNSVMNYLLLSATARVACSGASQKRLLAAALLGGAYAVIQRMGLLGVLDGACGLGIMMALMITTAFAPGSVKEFARTSVLFLLCCFCVGGGSYALCHAAERVPSISAITQLSAPLVGLGFSAAGLKSVLSGLRCRVGLPQNVELGVRVGKKTVSLNAFLDTGNRLHDPLTGVPVILAEREAVVRLMPTEVSHVFERICVSGPTVLLDDNIALEDSKWASRFCVLPFESIGKENGMLVGFRPDEVFWASSAQHRVVIKAVIGVVGQKISATASHNALVGPAAMLKGGTNGVFG